MLADFKRIGTFPSMIDRLKIVAIIGLSSSAYYFKNHRGNPSGPLAVFFSRFSA